VTRLRIAGRIRPRKFDEVPLTGNDQQINPMKKTKLILAVTSLLIASAFTAQAQYKTTNATYDGFGAEMGEWEVTLGGSGSTNKDFNNSLGGVNVSLGYFVSDMLEVVGRQSANYSNSTTSDAEFDGSTFVALDYHFGTSNLRPFVGVNFGALYGENTSDTWAAGIEGGLKFYVKPKTFVFALVNYAWTFEDSEDADDAFSDGAFLWSVGVGFNL
jgi:hypothetical protein